MSDDLNRRVGALSRARIAGRLPRFDIPGLLFTGKRVWQEIATDRVLSVAGGLTFFALLALFPAITAIVSIFGLFADPAEVGSYLAGFTSVLPNDSATLLVDQARMISAENPANLSLAAVAGLVFALWSANGGTKALIEALNVAYGVPETRGFVRLHLISLGSTVCGILTALVLIVAVAILPAALNFVWLGGIAGPVLLISRWPAIFLVMLGLLAVIYRWGSNRRDAAWRWITPGAVLASSGLIVFSLLFSWYASNISDLNRTYGSLGAVVALMIWMWMSATVILVGAELNAELDRQTLNAEKKGPVAAPPDGMR